MNQLRGTRAGAAAEVALLDQRNAEPPPGGIACDAGTGDASANDGDVEEVRSEIPEFALN
jgi:hypothetical protein